MDISRMSLAVAADSKEKELYVKYCRDLNMEPEWVNRDFIHSTTKKEFTLLGLNKRGHLFTVVIISEAIIEPKTPAVIINHLVFASLPTSSAILE